MSRKRGEGKLFGNLLPEQCEVSSGTKLVSVSPPSEIEGDEAKERAWQRLKNPHNFVLFQQQQPSFGSPVRESVYLMNRVNS